MQDWISNALASIDSAPGVLGAGFIAAFFVPGGAEAFLYTVGHTHQELTGLALPVVCVANVSAGMCSYLGGRWLATHSSLPKKAQPWVDRVPRWGRAVSLLAWVPWIGEGICIARFILTARALFP
jgi:membrane protein YqaA with SNARE-associated domain